MTIAYRSMLLADADQISSLADVLVGTGYYPPETVRSYLERSTANGLVLSYVATAESQIVAFRFTFAPGRWDSGRGKGLTVDRWPTALEKTGYFQSCFVDDAYMGKGIGRELASRSIGALREARAEAVVAHCWKESPHNSSFRYLSKLGFEAVAEYPGYWSEIDYVCRLDGQPCQCTAIEMVKDLIVG